MEFHSNHLGDAYPTVVEGLTFLICTDALYDTASGRLSGEWRAWSFFAYDRAHHIYPAGKPPAGVETVESIVGGSGDSEHAARFAVEKKLRTAIVTKNLEGTGFYSPPAGIVYPHGLPNEGIR